MKRLFTVLLAIALECAFVLVPATAIAQSNPGFIYGVVPSAAQWNSYFSAKTDLYPGGIPISLGGTGATTANQGLNNLTGAVGLGLYLRGNGTNVVAGTIQAADVPTLNQSTTGTAGGLSGGAVGSVPYQSAGGVTNFLAGNSTTTPMFLTSTGTGATATTPTFSASTGSGSVVLATSPTITSATLNTATIANPTFTASTGSGSVVLATSPTLNTATLANPSVTGVFTVNSKTLALSNSLTLAGTDGTTMTFPSTSASVARIDTSQTFAGTQTFSGTITGAATTSLFASPPAIGTTVAASGSFTNLTATGTVSGAGFSTYLASPPAIGGSAPAAGAFTTVSASSTVSGAGFSTYLASPPAIGGTVPAAVSGSTVTGSASFAVGPSAHLLVSSTAPTISSCGSGSPSISANNGTAAFRVTVGSGTPPSACTINLPTASTGWNCFASNTTTLTNAWQIKMSASSNSAVTLTNYNSGSVTAWTVSDVLAVSCFAY